MKLFISSTIVKDIDVWGPRLSTSIASSPSRMEMLIPFYLFNFSGPSALKTGFFSVSKSDLHMWRDLVSLSKLIISVIRWVSCNLSQISTMKRNTGTSFLPLITNFLSEIQPYHGVLFLSRHGGKS